MEKQKSKYDVTTTRLFFKFLIVGCGTYVVPDFWHSHPSVSSGLGLAAGIFLQQVVPPRFRIKWILIGVGIACFAAIVNLAVMGR